MNPRPISTITVQARSIRGGDRLVSTNGLPAGIYPVMSVDYGDDLSEVIIKFRKSVVDLEDLRLRASAEVVIAHSYMDDKGKVWTVNRRASAVVAQWELTSTPAPEGM